MDPRQQHRQPDTGADDQIRCQRRDPQPVERDQHRDPGQRRAERCRIDARGIGNGDDGDRAQIVDDGDGGEQELEARRHPLAEQRQHPQRKGDVGRRRDRPAAQRRRIAAVEGDEDRRRNHHPGQGRDAGQDAAARARQFAVDQLALHLEADQQEKHRHQAVVDPVQQRRASERQMDGGVIGRRQR